MKTGSKTVKWKYNAVVKKGNNSWLLGDTIIN